MTYVNDARAPAHVDRAGGPAAVRGAVRLRLLGAMGEVVRAAGQGAEEGDAFGARSPLGDLLAL
jgi:hypothetical protein